MASSAIIVLVSDEKGITNKLAFYFTTKKSKGFTKKSKKNCLAFCGVNEAKAYFYE
jgi:hypothetical protein